MKGLTFLKAITSGTYKFQMCTPYPFLVSRKSHPVSLLA